MTTGVYKRQTAYKMGYSCGCFSSIEVPLFMRIWGFIFLHGFPFSKCNVALLRTIQIVIFFDIFTMDLIIWNQVPLSCMFGQFRICNSTSAGLENIFISRRNAPAFNIKQHPPDTSRECTSIISYQLIQLLRLRMVVIKSSLALIHNHGGRRRLL